MHSQQYILAGLQKLPLTVDWHVWNDKLIPYFVCFCAANMHNSYILIFNLINVRKRSFIIWNVGNQNHTSDYYTFTLFIHSLFQEFNYCIINSQKCIRLRYFVWSLIGKKREVKVYCFITFYIVCLRII
jgi:hypothetical protein